MSLKDYNARIDAKNAANGITPEQYEKAVARLKEGAMKAEDTIPLDELELAVMRERMNQRAVEDGLIAPPSDEAYIYIITDGDAQPDPRIQPDEKV